MNFILQVVRAARAASKILCLYNEQNKTYTPFLSHIIFTANLSSILIGTVLYCAAIQSDERELAYWVMTEAF